MTSKVYQKCTYCGSTITPDSSKICQACGAPLEPPAAVVIEKNEEATRRRQQALEKEEKQARQIRQAAAKVEDAYFWVWHTLAQIFAIALTGAALGLIGGATGLPVWGVLAAGAVGLAVGNVYKWSLFEAFSAPLGLVLGSALGVLVWWFWRESAVFLVTATLGAVALALLGNRQVAYAERGLWQKIRPFVGLLGGLAVGALAALPGAALRALILAM